jgi:hypothetical protein
MSNVKVACHLVNGMNIRLFRQGYDDGTGDNVRQVIQDGPGVRLNGPDGKSAGVGDPAGGKHLPPGVTEVDEEWARKWLAQNKLNPFVAEGLIYIVDDKVEDEVEKLDADPTPAT